MTQMTQMKLYRSRLNLHGIVHFQTSEIFFKICVICEICG